jgi:hypothetical protein
VVSTREETIVLGAEYDDGLRAALREVLVDLGGNALRRDWGVGGSQELERVETQIEGQRLLIEAETYMGLSITGSSELVQKVQRLVNARMVARR